MKSVQEARGSARARRPVRFARWTRCARRGAREHAAEHAGVGARGSQRCGPGDMAAFSQVSDQVASLMGHGSGNVSFENLARLMGDGRALDLSSPAFQQILQTVEGEMRRTRSRSSACGSSSLAWSKRAKPPASKKTRMRTSADAAQSGANSGLPSWTRRHPETAAIKQAAQLRRDSGRACEPGPATAAQPSWPRSPAQRRPAIRAQDPHSATKTVPRAST